MPRKMNGEGSIRKRGAGYEARIQMPDGSRPSVYGKTRQEVLNKLRELQGLRAQGRSLGQADQKVEDYLYHWLSTARRKRQFSASSAEAYEKRLRWIIPYIGHLKMNRLRAAHIDEAYAGLIDSGRSTSTVYSIHGTMRQAFQKAVLQDQIAVNPFLLVKPPSPAPPPMSILTGEQLRALWRTSADSEWYPLWVLLGTTGMRLGEALGLCWPQVHPTSIDIVQSLHPERGRGMVVGPTKNFASERSIDLTRFCASALETHRQRQTIRALDGQQDFVFRHPDGTPYRHEKIRIYFNQALAVAGLSQIRVHDLRHTYATLMLEKQVPVKKVAETLGHANANITLKTYSHVTRAMDAAALYAMSAIIEGSDAPPEGENGTILRELG